MVDVRGIPLTSTSLTVDDSDSRWRRKKNRYSKAWDSMIRLRNNPIQVARDIYYIHSQLVIERELIGKTNYITRFAQLFTIPRVRRANLAAFTVMIAQQVR